LNEYTVLPALQRVKTWLLTAGSLTLLCALLLAALELGVRTEDDSETPNPPVLALTYAPI
jgi:hypothetical protein